MKKYYNKIIEKEIYHHRKYVYNKYSNHKIKASWYYICYKIFEKIHSILYNSR